MAVVKISTKFGTDPITVDPGDVAPAYDLSATGSGAFKYGQLMFRHYKIAPSVSSNNLTVALQHLDGSDASATRPLFFMINGSLRSVTAALSVTMNAATNWMNAGASELATKEIDYFVYIGYNATDGVVLGVSRIPFAKQYNDFSTTSTNEKYARISTITTAASTDPYQNIGRYAATLSAGAGYTWTVPTYTPSNLIQQPIYYTRFLTWVPTIVGYSSNPTTTTYQYWIDNTTCKPIMQEDVDGTSNSATTTYTLPFSSTIARNFSLPIVRDNTTSEAAGVGQILAGSLGTLTAKRSAIATWTTSGGKRIVTANLEYFI